MVKYVDDLSRLVPELDVVVETLVGEGFRPGALQRLRRRRTAASEPGRVSTELGQRQV